MESTNVQAPVWSNLPRTLIAPARGWVPVRLGELWEYRELLYFLMWREIKVGYKQTLLGVTWAIVQPVLAMVVFSVFFGRLAGMPSDGVPYPIFVYAALLPWQLFSTSLSQASNSVTANQALVTKVYFPRLMMPLASVAVGVLDFLLALTVLVGMMVYYGLTPGLALVTLPFWSLLAVLTALGVGLWLSALNVRYRDVRYAVPFMVQVWLFVTPVVYSSSIVPAAWRPVYALNPMVGVVDGFRWALLGTSAPSGVAAAVSFTMVIVTLVTGLFYFRRTERTFADVV